METTNTVASAYDAMAETYDDAFSDTESQQENQEVFNIVGYCKDLDVLDIGCGTGLALEYIYPRSYVGIDPSRGMLEQFKKKYPTRKPMLSRFEEADFNLLYDVVLCLFGSAAYIESDHLMRIPGLLKPGGKYVVMFMDDDYVPVAYERTGSGVIPYKAGIHAPLPGKRHHIGHYTIIVGPEDE